MSNEPHPNVTWEEARLLIFNKIDDIDDGIKDLKKSMHEEFRLFKEEFAESNKLKHEEMQKEIDGLEIKVNKLMQNSKVDEGKSQGKAGVYTIIATSIALIVSVGGLIADFIK